MTPNELGVLMATMVAPRQALEPAVAEAIGRNHYAIDAVATPLTGERDENVLLTARDGSRTFLKFASAFEDPAVTRF